MEIAVLVSVVVLEEAAVVLVVVVVMVMKVAVLVVVVVMVVAVIHWYVPVTIFDLKSNSLVSPYFDLQLQKYDDKR